MTKLFRGITAFLFLSLILSGCGSAKNSTADSTGDSQGSQVSSTDRGDWGTNKQPPADRGQFSAPDMMGEVDSVNGNEITVKVMKMPERNSDRQKNANDGTQSAPPENQTAQTPENQTPQANVEYTGETKILKISDDTPITKMSMGQDGQQTQQLKITDIKKGDVLQVYFSDKETETVSKITLGSEMGMGMRPQRQNEQQQSQ